MLNRRMILAIDHGSTNSAMAVMTPKGPQVIHYGSTDKLLFPSCVFVYANKRSVTGQAARIAAKTEFEQGDFQDFYKPCLGQDTLFPFVKAGIVKTAVEMASDVMGAMLGTARSATRQEIHGAVVTVPAMFEQSRADATRDAALAAGLKYVCTLQEPVAAAMAYGFDAREMEDQTWCVVDHGGGTLDVSLVMVREGQITSPEGCQLGDNFCGGGHWDKAILMYLIKERLQKAPHKYKLASLTINSKSSAWFRLLLAVEEAKIELSEKEEAVVHVDGVLCKDDTGRDVTVNLRFTRSELESLISPFVEKACTVVQDLISRKGARVSRIILVGGPTKTPYYRKRLADAVGIPIDTSIEPMTAVVRGAALYATSQMIPLEVFKEVQTGPAPGAVELRVAAPPHSGSAKAPIQGCLVGQDDFSHWSIEIQRKDGGWASGRLAVGRDGDFEVEAVLVAQSRPYCSEFAVRAYNPQGRVAAEYDQVQIWHPFPIAQVSLPNPLLVELKDNQTAVLVAAGTKLPGEGQDSFATTREIRAIPLPTLLQNLRERVNTLFAFTQGKASSSFADDSIKDQKANLVTLEAKVQGVSRGDEDEIDVRKELGEAMAEIDKLERRLVAQGLKIDLSNRPVLDVLRIRILEGVPNALGTVQDAAADCNLPVGELVISAASLRRTLPAGSEVVVAVTIDESRLVNVRAYIPLLEDEFEARLQSGGHGMSLEDALRRFEATRKRLEAVQEFHKKHPVPAVQAGLDRLREIRLEDSIRQAFELGRGGDVQSVERGIMQTLELQGTVEQMEQQQAPITVRGDLEKLKELTSIVKLENGAEMVADFEKRLASAASGGSVKVLAEEIRSKDVSVRVEHIVSMLKRIGAMEMAIGAGTITLTSSQRNLFQEARDFWHSKMSDGNPGFLNLANPDFRKAWEWHQQIESWFRDNKSKLLQAEDAFMAAMREAMGGSGGPGMGGGGADDIGVFLTKMGR